MTRHGVAVLTLLVATALPAAAQHDVARRSFIFLDRNLTIEVVSENSGVLRVMRGEPGVLEVAARAPEGLPGFALGGRQNDLLQLSAMGADKADFLVIVSEDVRVTVRLPDRKLIETAGRPAATFSWGKDDSSPTGGNGGGGNSRASTLAVPAASGMFLSHYSRAVPVSFSVPDANNLGRLEVRFDGSDFRLSTNRAVNVKPGRSDTIELRAVDPGLNAVISLPTDTRDFRLVLGGKLALEVRTGEIRSFCDQLQRSVDDPRVYSFAPGGELVCR